MNNQNSKSSLSKTLWILLIIGFAIMEFPGVFFINRIEPFVLGLPFIYGFTIVMWIYMSIVLFVAYKTNWGKGAGFVEGENEENEKERRIQ